MSGTSTVKPKLRHSEQGMVAIVTTMVLMLVISLIVLGFAQITRRNQRESLDRQLSTQAFYAAESGVNDARRLIKQAVENGQTVQDKTSCGGSGVAGFYASLNPVIDAAHNVKYSCLLVDAAPRELRFSDVGTTSTIVPMISQSGENFSTVKLDWQSKITTGNPTTGCPTATNNVFTPVGGWGCGYGVLRFDLVPTAGSTLTVDSLQANTMTVFAVPLRTGGVASIPFAAGTNANNRTGVACTNTQCSLTITGLNTNTYHLRVSSIYKGAALQVSGSSASGGQIRISGAQAVIDATGKAQDVLRRIQVNVPYRNTSENLLSDYAIESQGAFCKRYLIMDGFISIDGTDVVSTNPLCQTSVSP
jgi:Tfp pilus assembly protein PilV